MREVIGFIGGGNMATSLIGGLLNAEHPAEQIVVAEPNTDRQAYLKNTFGIRTSSNNADALHADATVLAVKPQVMRTVLTDLKDSFAENKPLLISVAAGLPIATLSSWITGNTDAADTAIIRCMPNTPSLVGAGASGLFANDCTTETQRTLAEHLLRGSGLAVWVDTEAQLDAVTALSGSGPAYYFAFMEAMQKAGEQLGLPSETARLLTIQTAFGAAKMALESKDSPDQLRVNVTSPGGTTEQALNAFATAGLDEVVQQAMDAANARAKTLAKELSH